MIKDDLKASEAVIYQILKRSFLFGKVSQAYLLKGERNPLKKETAILIAQSIIENSNDLACEECERCKRIKDGKYYDVIYIDGNIKNISKGDIEKIFDEFHKTSLEKSAKKVFIIDKIENGNPKVWNMILKSIEEPNSNSYWIFISDNVDKIPSTIVSRCESLSFHRVNEKYVCDAYLKDGFENIDAYLLTKIFQKKIDIELNDKAYLLAKEFVEKTIDNLNKPFALEFIFNSEWYGALKKSETDIFKASQDYYLDIMIKIFTDRARKKAIDDSWYQNLLNEIDYQDVDSYLEIFYDIKDRSLTMADRKLLFDRLAYEIVSYKRRKQ